MLPLGQMLYFSGRVNYPPHHLPDNDDVVYPTSSSPLLPLSLTPLYDFSYLNFTDPIVPHILQHACPPPHPPVLLVFHPHHQLLHDLP